MRTETTAAHMIVVQAAPAISKSVRDTHDQRQSAGGLPASRSLVHLWSIHPTPQDST